MPPQPLAVVRVLIGIAAGAITGSMIALAVASLPPFFIADGGGGGLGGGMMALFFLAAPVGVILGAIAGAYMAHRNALRYCLALLVMSVAAAPMIATAGADAAMASSPPVPEPTTCTYQSRGTTFLPAGSIVDVFKRRCPGLAHTIEVSLHPSTHSPADVGPGNALVLDASQDSRERPLLVSARAGAGAELLITYDSRARVIRQETSVGGMRLRVVPDSPLRSGAPPQAVSATTTTDTSVTGAVVALARVATPTCVVAARATDAAPTSTVSIITLTCPGKPPTIEAWISTHPGGGATGTHDIALALDASADSPSQPIVVRIVRPTSSDVVLDVDSRARVIRMGPPPDGVRVTVVGGAS